MRSCTVCLWAGKEAWWCDSNRAVCFPRLCRLEPGQIFTFLPLFPCCTSFGCPVEMTWALIWDQFDVVCKSGQKSSTERERERESSHTPSTRTTFLSCNICRPLLCAETRAETNFTDKSGEDILVPQNSSFLLARALWKRVFIWAVWPQEFQVTRIPSARMTSPVTDSFPRQEWDLLHWLWEELKTVTGTFAFLYHWGSSFWTLWSCCQWIRVPYWWWPLFLGCTTLLKGDAQEGAVKAQISPVSLQTGGWTVSMGCAIVMRGV